MSLIDLETKERATMTMPTTVPTTTTTLKILLLAPVLAMALASVESRAEEQRRPEAKSGPAFVSEPSVPTITPAVRDLPDYKPEPNLFGLEMKRRDDYGFIPIPYPIEPKVDPLLDLQSLELGARQPDSFSSVVHNFAGQNSGASPPDATGDVGPSHFVQSVNQSVSTVEVINKLSGNNMKTFTMQSLTNASPCNTGFCDSVTLYDRAADRWLISELPRSGPNVCVYVSTSGDPMGTWYAYTFAVETSGITDYPKYGVWPQSGEDGETGGSYLIGVNAGASGTRDVFALDREKMLQGLPATFQRFSVPRLPNSGFQLVLPSTMQGNTPPPDGEPAIFMRPHDDEAEEGANTPYDLMDMWALRVDWATPANSSLTQLPSLHIGDYDMTLCGLGGIWNCMPQPGTSQRIDPIREPLHFPLQYRNFGDHQTLVGTFPEDVDGTDHAAMRWFEIRKTGAGDWGVFQEGVVGGEAGVHRAVGSIAMDGAGNIAMGYTRTGGSPPYYPSIYYKGRLSTDPPGTMPQGEYTVQDASNSKTNNERWGDYAGIGIDPADDCTFWFTSEFGGNGNTRVAAFKFDQCGCLAVPQAPAASAVATQDNRIDVSWNDSATDSITEYVVYRSTTSGGPYTAIATVADSSPGVANGPAYTYHDDTVSGGVRYYYTVKSTDNVICTSPGSQEVSALASGRCLLTPSFAGLVSVSDTHNATCTVNLSWSAGASSCSGSLSYNIYRSTTSNFTPSPANRIATGVSATTFSDGVGITYGTKAYYVVRAVDVTNGVEDANTVHKNAVPTGVLSFSTLTDTFEGSQSGGGFDLSGWTHATLSGTTNWTWSTAQVRDGAHSWFAPDWYEVGDKALVSPPFGVGSNTVLSFYHTYAFEGPQASCYDGGTLEYTTDGGSTWIVVPTADFTAGPFTGRVGSGLQNPIGGLLAWCGGTIGPMAHVVVNLGADPNVLNKTIQVRWHEGDDKSVSSTGWYVDSVTLSNVQTAGVCQTGTASLTVSNNGPVCESGTLSLTSSYTQGGVTYSWTGPNGFTSGQQSPTIPNATPAASGTYALTVSAGGPPVASSSTDVTVIAEGAACSDGNGCTANDACQAGVCVSGNPIPVPSVTTGLAVATIDDLSWAPVSGATGYDVVRGTVSALLPGGKFTPATDACVATNVAATSMSDAHLPAPGQIDWYLVRARNACGAGTYDDGSASQVGSRDAGIAASPHACP